ncbi:MBL fold metallo-hydrolase [Candidatus Pacearchaeota archaeon]|nr:MBL fold metallo-hydrolase [Candidatus Pacearchaeota archaeon]
MKISALSSGSSGNCFYVSDKNNSVLIDCGISCRQVLEKLSDLKQNPTNLKAIFVSHEHTDHIKGVDVLAREFGIPVYATKGTYKNCFLCSDESLIQEIKEDETIKIGNMEISSFLKSHDAASPVSFNIKNGKQISIITDIGYACKSVCENVSDSDFLVLESNHDISMLESGPYPYFLKKRIASNLGHLSNLHSGLCVLEHGTKKLKNIVLAHLSAVNNTSSLALSNFRNLIKERKDMKPKIFVSERGKHTPIFDI